MVYHKIKCLAFTVAFMFLVTFLIFPGLTVSLKPINKALDKGWFGIVLITEFNVCDFIGRTLAGYGTFGFTPGNLWILSALRILTYPAFVLNYLGEIHGKAGKTDATVYALMGFLAVTNGFICTAGMMWAPQDCEDHEKEVAGNFMVFFLQGGIQVGSAAALAITKLTGWGH